MNTHVRSDMYEKDKFSLVPDLCNINVGQILFSALENAMVIFGMAMMAHTKSSTKSHVRIFLKCSAYMWWGNGSTLQRWDKSDIDTYWYCMRKHSELYTQYHPLHNIRVLREATTCLHRQNLFLAKFLYTHEALISFCAYSLNIYILRQLIT